MTKNNYNKVNGMLRSIDPEVICGIPESDLQEIHEAVASEQNSELSGDEQDTIGKLLDEQQDRANPKPNHGNHSEGGTQPPPKNI